MIFYFLASIVDLDYSDLDLNCLGLTKKLVLILNFIMTYEKYDDMYGSVATCLYLFVESLFFHKRIKGTILHLNSDQDQTLDFFKLKIRICHTAL